MYPWLEKPYEALLQQYFSNTLHHALLLKSPYAIGADRLAQDVAKSMLCQDKSSLVFCGKCKACKLMDGQVHPDFHELMSEKPTIGVDLIRQLIEKIQKTAQLSGSKVVVINQIQMMTEAASNAFLKTLEEPTPDTFIIITTSQPDRLLPTIRSRCEQIALAVPSYAQSVDFLQRQNVAPPSEQLLKVYGNSPLPYLDALKTDEMTYIKFKGDLQRFVTDDIGTSEFAEKYAGKESSVLDWLYHVIGDVMSTTLSAEHNNDENNDVLLCEAQLIELQDWVYKTMTPAKKKLLHQGINKTLLLKTVLEDFKQGHLLAVNSQIKWE